jgi:hypothetical protein
LSVSELGLFGDYYLASDLLKQTYNEYFSETLPSFFILFSFFILYFLIFMEDILDYTIFGVDNSQFKSFSVIYPSPACISIDILSIWVLFTVFYVIVSYLNGFLYYYYVFIFI